MYKIISFRYESVIKKNFAAQKYFGPPPNHKSVPTALRRAIAERRKLEIVKRENRLRDNYTAYRHITTS